ncbi:imelysin family protein [Cerasicoccus frondis]|uniref:imelysin family protein n=1 Tax=Cerasicoccus frondis TaxID=490090 RepID=UPI0028525586|nr:imelysin family protein [Cerasicoccus frondis]
MLAAFISSFSQAQTTESRVLATLAADAIEPMLTQAADCASQLHGGVVRLCANPTESTLREAREEWKQAYLAWNRAAVFRFGPVAILDRKINRWAVNDVVLDAAVESQGLDHLLTQAEQRGFAALEYLLFAPDNVSAATTPGRCAHLLAISAEIDHCATEAQQLWSDGFAAEFIAAGDGEPFLTTSDALSIIYVRLLNVTEHLLLDQIGLPSAFFKGAATPENLPAWRSESTIVGMQAAIDGVQLALLGNRSDSLLNLVATQDGLVEKCDPALATAIRKQLNKIQNALAKLQQSSTPIDQQLKKDPTTLKDLYGQLNKLQKQLIEGSLVLELDVYTGKQPTFASGGNP